MNSKQSDDYPLSELALNLNYFSESLLPDLPDMYFRTVFIDQPYAQNDGIEVLYIVEGSGELEVNGLSHRVGPGSAFILFFYHFHRLLPDGGKPIKIACIHITYNTYLFMSTAPGWDLSFFEQNLYMPQAIMTGAVKARFDNVIQQLQDAMESTDDEREQQVQVLLSELIARLFRQAASNARKKSPR